MLRIDDVTLPDEGEYAKLYYIERRGLVVRFVRKEMYYLGNKNYKKNLKIEEFHLMSISNLTVSCFSNCCPVCQSVDGKLTERYFLDDLHR